MKIISGEKRCRKNEAQFTANAIFGLTVQKGKFIPVRGHGGP
jgi:hypothetical protein